MARRPEQILVLPFRRGEVGLEFALFRRSDRDQPCWQGIAGGVEDDETPEKAARREMAEEAGIDGSARLVALDSVASVPAFHFAAHDEWGPDVYVVTEHCFGVEVPLVAEIVLSTEHVEFRWVGYTEAADRLEWDSNRTALWELNERLLRAGSFRTG
jgi:dihydroneopterin triphosphate diphosphatase